ncbi:MULTISPECIES: hypothetical protein [unclassified Microcoleus]|nr:MULTISPECIES: hypothetical protein [unclassified Microcoleus]
MEDGRWKMEDGRWKMEESQLITFASGDARANNVRERGQHYD